MHTAEDNKNEEPVQPCSCQDAENFWKFNLPPKEEKRVWVGQRSAKEDVAGESRGSAAVGTKVARLASRRL